MENTHPVAVVDGPEVVTRCTTIKEAEAFIASLWESSPEQRAKVERGDYGIDAPEDMHRCPETKRNGHGGIRAGQGRKPSDNPTRTRSIRLKPEQWAKFSALGGTDWLRAKLAEAEVQS
jgi:hypothetical protein